MSILTGPEIERLAMPCTVADLGRHECVWRHGERLRVLAIDRRPDDSSVCLENADGRQAWERIDADEPLTRCGAAGERIVIAPFDPAMVGPASYDVHLGDELRVYDTERYLRSDGGYIQKFLDHKPIDPLEPPTTRPAQTQPDPNGGRCWSLEPGRVYLAATRERTETHRLSAQVAGRSSWGRYGLTVHVTAGYIDPGFCGAITLELVAAQPILVRPGDKIAQLVYTTLAGAYRPYAGRYQNAPAEPVPSRFHLSDTRSAEEQIAAIRAAGGSDWDEIANPAGFLAQETEGDQS